MPEKWSLDGVDPFILVYLFLSIYAITVDENEDVSIYNMRTYQSTTYKYTRRTDGQTDKAS